MLLGRSATIMIANFNGEAGREGRRAAEVGKEKKEEEGDERRRRRRRRFASDGAEDRHRAEKERGLKMMPPLDGGGRQATNGSAGAEGSRGGEEESARARVCFSQNINLFRPTSLKSAMNAAAEAAAAKSQENCRVPLNIVQWRRFVVVVIREWERTTDNKCASERGGGGGALPPGLPGTPDVKRANDKCG